MAETSIASAAAAAGSPVRSGSNGSLNSDNTVAEFPSKEKLPKETRTLTMIMNGTGHKVKQDTLADKAMFANMTRVASIAKHLIDFQWKTPLADVAVCSDELVSVKNSKSTDPGDDDLFGEDVKSLNDIDIHWIWALLRKLSSRPIPIQLVSQICRKSQKNFKNGFTYLSGTQSPNNKRLPDLFVNFNCCIY